MSDHDNFLDRADVKSALDELVAQRMVLTEGGVGDAELPNAVDHLREQGIDVPQGANVRILRTIHDGEARALAPMCNGERARPVNCRWIGKHYVCDWVCP